jgi:branched-chain amino acid aminotransferase
MFGTQPNLGLEISDRFTFIVIASPSEAVAAGPLRIVIERDATRAASGGTGAIKFSGNYGASLYSTVAAQNAGFDQPLWLDAAEHRYIEELSIMNFFAVIDGEIHTPELSDTILPGVTRDSLLTLARDNKITVNECKLDADMLLENIQSGRCTEAFACGTAVIVAPISHVGEKDGTLYELPEPTGRISQLLRKELLDTQEGRKPDVSAWLYKISRHYYSM